VQIRVNLEQFLATCMCRIRVSYWGEKEVCIRIRGNFWRLLVHGGISACPQFVLFNAKIMLARGELLISVTGSVTVANQYLWLCAMISSFHLL
jgi:hypothetical protein